MFGAVFAALAMWCSCAASAASEDAGTDDAALRSEIISALEAEESVAAPVVQVGVHNGIASLTGHVADRLAGDRAVAVALAVEGVRAVIDRVEIATTEQSDADLARAIIGALGDDPATAAHQVDVAVEDAFVTLTGTVESAAEKELVGKIARGVRGVRAVANATSVEPPTIRTDGAIAADIRSRFRWDLWLDDRRIDVVVVEGAVTLAGAVANEAERKRAAAIADVAGVESVDVDDLDIELGADRPIIRPPEGVDVEPEAMAAAAKAALEADPRVLIRKLEVEAKDDTIILRGAVPDQGVKETAGEDAMNTAGVRAVQNDLRVSGDLPETEVIRRKIETALVRDSFLTDAELVVTMSDRTATLAGTVGSRFEKERANSLASAVPGVGEVVDRIELVGAASIVSGDELRGAIEAALAAEPGIDPAAVAVRVDGDRATLSGTVPSEALSRKAAQIAYQSGAKSVDNRLTTAERGDSH